jgi:hypothetical protein
MIAMTSSPPTALSMNSERKRSWSGVEPEVLRRVARSTASCSGVTETPIFGRLLIKEKIKEL